MSEQAPDGPEFRMHSVAGCEFKVPRRSAEELAACGDRERKRQEQAHSKLIRAIGIPARYAHVSLVTSRDTPALAHVRTYLAHGLHAGRCLVLSGPTGVGKTHAAVAGLLAAEAGGRRFCYFPGLCGALLDPGRRAESLDKAKTAKIMVWDDFGVEYTRPDGFLNTLIDGLVWHREAEQLPTIITTNLTADQLRDHLSDRIVDRLAGDWGQIVQLPGESLRREEYRRD